MDFGLPRALGLIVTSWVEGAVQTCNTAIQAISTMLADVIAIETEELDISTDFFEEITAYIEDIDDEHEVDEHIVVSSRQPEYKSLMISAVPESVNPEIFLAKDFNMAAKKAVDAMGASHLSTIIAATIASAGNKPTEINTAIEETALSTSQVAPHGPSNLTGVAEVTNELNQSETHWALLILFRRIFKRSNADPMTMLAKADKVKVTKTETKKVIKVIKVKKVLAAKVGKVKKLARVKKVKAQKAKKAQKTKKSKAKQTTDKSVTNMGLRTVTVSPRPAGKRAKDELSRAYSRLSPPTTPIAATSQQLSAQISAKLSQIFTKEGKLVDVPSACQDLTGISGVRDFAYKEGGVMTLESISPVAASSNCPRILIPTPPPQPALYSRLTGMRVTYCPPELINSHTIPYPGFAESKSPFMLRRLISRLVPERSDTKSAQPATLPAATGFKKDINRFVKDLFHRDEKKISWDDVAVGKKSKAAYVRSAGFVSGTTSLLRTKKSLDPVNCRGKRSRYLRIEPKDTRTENTEMESAAVQVEAPQIANKSVRSTAIPFTIDTVYSTSNSVSVMKCTPVKNDTAMVSSSARLGTTDPRKCYQFMIKELDDAIKRLRVREEEESGKTEAC
ncbi:uncharacterized protein V2V93DRAFT_285768 [Kockiozyma suomiensis]|uniref:uncharacterized protein n=1 Tax=Kockiozyma suomiensis TaxID=1337062 RepID=UPI003342F74D